MRYYHYLHYNLACLTKEYIDRYIECIEYDLHLYRLYGYNDNLFIAAPSGSPTNVHCQSRSPNSILLEWSKPKREERNGIIRGYWIEYYPRTLWYGK